MTWVVPGAIVDYVRNRSTPVRDKTLGLILHVQAGSGALDGWFDNPASQASSTWQARKSGEIRQFGDPDKDKMWAQAAGNTDYASVESEGQPSEPLTPEQVEAIARIYAEGHKQEGWPFQLAEKPGDRGLGWHGMGGSAWGGHTGCPGNLRKAQRGAILARAKQIVEGDDMIPDDILKADVIPSPMMGSKNPTVTVISALSYAMQWSLAARNAAQDGARDAAAALTIAKDTAAKLASITDSVAAAVVAKLPAAQGGAAVDPAILGKAVVDELASRGMAIQILGKA